MITTGRMLVPGSLATGARPIDRLFEQFLGYEAAMRADGTPTYLLPLDIVETEDAYELHATIAGVPQDSVEVTFETGMLSIAVKAAPVEVQGTLIRQERPWGNWSRKLELPKGIDSAKIAAQFERIAIGEAGRASPLPKGRG
jgi:HSP20 family molecular chaperone IbpA